MWIIVFEMRLPKTVRKVLTKYPALIITATVFYAVILLLATPSLNKTPLSAVFAIAFVIMLSGQISTISNYSFAYFLYYASCVISFVLALYLWMSARFPFYDIYFLVLLSVLVVIHVSHLVTRKRLETLPAFSIFSIFLFGLLIAFSTGTMAQQTTDWLFWLTVTLFMFVVVQCLNAAYRVRILNKSLQMSSIEEYCMNCESRLHEKFKTETADTDLLLYYLRSSLRRFTEGDFEGSFIDAYKIVFDEDGRAFEKLYVLPNAKELVQPYSRTRAVLAHAKGRDAILSDVKKTKRRLFEDTINILTILKRDFIEGALSRRESDGQTMSSDHS